MLERLRYYLHLLSYVSHAIVIINGYSGRRGDNMAFTVMNNATTLLAIAEKNRSELSKALNKVSSGMKLNSASDGTADYTISEKMRVMIRSLQQNHENISHAKNLLRQASEGVNQQISIMKTLSEIAIKASNDIYNDYDRQTMEKEVSNLLQECDDIANTTNFNNINLLNRGSLYNAEVVLVQNGDNNGTNGNAGSTGSASGVNTSTSNTNLYEINYRFYGHGDNRRNSISNQFFPTPDRRNNTYASSIGWTVGYTTGRYDRIPYDSNGRIYVWDSNGRLNSIPPAGVSVQYYHKDEPTGWVTQPCTGITYQDPESGEIRIRPTGLSTDRARYSTVKLDLSRIPGASGTGNLEDDFDNQAMSFLCKECFQAVSIHYTKALNIGEAKEYRTADVAGLSDWGTTFVVGVGGASSYQEIEAATFNSIMAINGRNSYSANSVNLTNPHIDNTDITNVHTISLNKYEYNGKTVYQITKENITLDLIAFEGRIGELSVTQQSEPEPIEPDPIDPDPTEPDTPPQYSYRYKTEPYDILHIQTGDVSSSFTNIKLYNTTIGVLFPTKDTNFNIPEISDFYPKYTKNNQSKVSTISQAKDFMEEVDNALQYLLNVNTLLGSQCSRFEAFSQIKETQIYGVENAESVIRDADMAKELTNYTKQNVLSQASQAVLAQANQKSFDVLSLLK